MPEWKEGDPIVCRFCGGTNCEHGDHCADCGCPECGMPGAQRADRGFCCDPPCTWEAVEGAYKAWKARQPKMTPHEVYRKVMEWFGAELPPDDEVGRPIFTTPKDPEGGAK